MKANMTSKGTLVIEPETDLEAFALKQWSGMAFYEVGVKHKAIDPQYVIVYTEVGAAPLVPPIKRFGE